MLMVKALGLMVLLQCEVWCGRASTVAELANVASRLEFTRGALK